MTNPPCGPELPPDRPTWSVPSSMVAPPPPPPPNLPQMKVSIQCCDCGEYAELSKTSLVGGKIYCYPCYHKWFGADACPGWQPRLPRPDDAEAVERLARAISAEYQDGVEHPIPWDKISPKGKALWRRVARAALTALWEGK